MATREQRKARADRLASAGMCWCGRNPVEPSRSKCGECKEANKQRNRKRRARLIDSGQCVECQKPAGFHTLCDTCLEITRIRSERRRTRIAIGSRTFLP